MAKYRLELTCGANPEQYDVYIDNRYVGYMKLKNGHFHVIDAGGNCVYKTRPHGENCFKDNERVMHLNAGCRAFEDKQPIYVIEA